MQTDPKDSKSPKTILVLGATGYVGGRLTPHLLEKGYRVRACGRSMRKLRSRYWSQDPHVELCAVDLMNLDDLILACQGCEVAYYLVHSMNPQHKDFVSADRKAALNMVQAAETTGLLRIIYLGGLGENNSNLSQHLQSRHEVAEILNSANHSQVQVTTLKAAMIIGSGSTSFEILRYLVDRLPVMITPRWVRTPSQPISIRNVIQYLLGCLENKATAGESFDIGGPEVITYHELMRIYAEEAGLRKRWVIPVPVLTPQTSSYWIHLVTPIPSYIAQPLAKGLRNPTVCSDQRIQKLIPLKLINCRTAIRNAVQLLANDRVSTHWTDSGHMPPQELAHKGDPSWAGGTEYIDQRSIRISRPAEKVWGVIEGIGGENGWFHGNPLWRLRGFLDRLVGGPGLSRGRRNRMQIQTGDALDFWRVLEVKKPSKLILCAEMKVPGQALLEFQIISLDAVGTCVQLQQTARFKPRGIAGIIYWYSVLPFHNYIFQGMIDQIKTRSLA